MRKFISIQLFLLFCIYCNAEEYSSKKIIEIQQGIEKNCIQLRNEDEIDGDDHSGNYITITNDGTLYINCWDLRSLLRVDLNKKTFDYQADLSNFQNELCQISLEQSEGSYLLFTGSWGNCKLYDPNKKELKFELNLDKSGISLESKAFHYDLKSDTLFIYDYDSNIHCILHPSMDQAQNRKNYRSPEQTLKMIENKEFGSHIELYKNKYLIIDGTITPWNTIWYGNYRYQVVDDYKVSLWDGSSSEINFEKKADEIVESTAIHPCGDVYRLIYNKKTKLHTLYCVENTWDTKWRKQWFKTHK